MRPSVILQILLPAHSAKHEAWGNCVETRFADQEIKHILCAHTLSTPTVLGLVLTLR